MADHLRNAARLVARFSAMSLGVIVISTAAFGLLYFLRQPTATWPGPRVIDALPLDELAGHDNVSLIVFVLVLALGGALVALLSRALSFDGLTIALVIGAGVGLWVFLASAISIFVVRQDALSDAFVQARNLNGTYLAAVLFGAAVALSATRSLGEHRLTRIIPSAVFLLGVLDLLAGSLPNPIGHFGELGDLLVGPSSPLTRTFDVVTGMLLLTCVSGLARRSYRALSFSIALSVAFLITRVVDTFSVVATIACVLVVILALTCRNDFSFRGDPSSHSVAFLRLGSVVLGGLLYSLLTLFISRTADGKTFHLSAALHETVRAIAGSSLSGDAQLSPGFATWFPWSLRAIVGLGLIWAAATWFAPWRHRLYEHSPTLARARSVVALWGSDSLAPFTLRADKAFFFYPEVALPPEETTLIAYRVLRGVAIVSGDPIGPAAQAREALVAYLAMAASRGWRVAIIGASEGLADTYRELGLHVLYHGDEAILDTENFSLQGGARKSIRQATQRVGRNGYQAEAMLAGELSAVVRAELETLEQAWLRGHPRKGFVMELDDLFRLDGEDAVFVIGRDREGALVGFLELAVCAPSRSLSLSTMPRSAAAPNGLNAVLIVNALEWAREHDFHSLSLNFAPGARLLGRDAHPKGLQRVARTVLLVAKRLFGLQLDDLLSFNRRFAPRWQPRYLVYQRHRHLPRVVTAAMAAERYLPFTDVLRGRDWCRPLDPAESVGPGPAT